MTYKNAFGLATPTVGQLSQNFAAIADQGGVAGIQQLNQPDQLVYHTHHAQSIHALDLSIDETRLLTGGADRKALLYDIENDTLLKIFNHVFETFTYEVTAASLSIDNSRAITGAFSDEAEDNYLLWLLGRSK